MRKTILLPVALFGSLCCIGQTTKEGYALSWAHTLTVVPDTLVNGTFKLPAHTITIFESDASTALDLWKADFKTMSTEVSGSKPMKAIGAVQPTIAEGPIMVLAQSTTDKKAGSARLTLAFAKNDSVAVDQQQAASNMAQQLAVKYNKAVVQAQLATKEKSLEKATDKLSDAQGDASKLEKKSGKINSDLKKTKSKQSKIQANNAKLSGEIAGLEKKFQMTNNAKDLEKLSKLRSKLVKGEADLAKQMRTETKAQDNLNKVEGDKPDAVMEQQEKAQTKEQVQQEIEALKRKLDNIR